MAFAEFETETEFLTELDATSDADALYQAGLAFSLGQDVDLDLVAAHKWFNLAAAKGHCEARDLRQEMADQMSSAEVAEALRAAREWLRRVH